MKRLNYLLLFLISFLMLCPEGCFSQARTIYRDSVVYRYHFRDTIVYRYDTVRIKTYVHQDTVWTAPTVVQAGPRSKGLFNHDSWGIGPMLGAYYSPYHGFDVNIGFGVQYYLFAVPSFRNPHMGGKRGHRK